MPPPPHRTTISIPAELLAAVDRSVRSGLATNRNQFILMAIEAEVRRHQRDAIDAELALMAAAPALQAECAQIMAEFASADRETWNRLARKEL